MLNNKGSSLIEVLFALQIYISVIICFVSLISTLNKASLKVDEKYDLMQIESIEEGSDFTSRIEAVLLS